MFSRRVWASTLSAQHSCDLVVAILGGFQKRERVESAEEYSFAVLLLHERSEATHAIQEPAAGRQHERVTHGLRVD